MSSVQDSLKAATALMMVGSDSDNTNDAGKVTESFKAATSLLSLMGDSTTTSTVESWSKTAVSKLKTTSVTEKAALQQLNLQLQTYLDNVKRLEAMNRALMAEVEKAKVNYAPKIMDKSGLDGSLSSIRGKLEEESMACVRFQTRIESNEILTSHITDRIKFFHQEAEIYKQKLYSLQNYLNEMNNQREFLKRNSKVAEDEIAREKTRVLQAEKDLEGILEKLKESRTRNKKLEFEMQTLLDEISFVKAIFNEEINDVRNRVSNGTAFSGNDLSSFYKNELAIAVRQIRDDFQTLNEHQLAEYKQLKEAELHSNITIIENEKVQMARLTASKDLEMQSVKELSSRLDENKSDLGSLSSRNYELGQKLTGLEIQLKDIRAKTGMELERKQAEIDTLRMQNEQYASELEYWDRVTRTKLESEIQTYRSILNSQIKLLETVSNNYVITQKLTQEVKEIKKPSVSTTITETVTTRPAINETIVTRPTVFETVVTRPAVAETIVSSGSKGSSTSSTYVTGGTWTVPEKVTTTKVTTITQEERERNEIVNILRQVFEYFDSDGSGYINSNEFDRVLSKLNVKLSREAYQKMLRENDLDSSRDIDFNEFLRIMLPVFTGRFEDEQLYYAFKKFDTNGSGYITTVELKELLSKIGQNFSEKDIARMIASVDRDGDGRLNFQEFVKLMKTPSQPAPKTYETVTTTVKKVEPGYRRDSRPYETYETVSRVRGQSQDDRNKTETINILKQVFDYFDSDGSGRINSSEFDRVLSKLNVKLSREAYNQIIREADMDLSRDIDFAEFCRIMLPVFTGRFEDEQLYFAFKKFDTDNSGYITVDELKQLLAKIGQNYSDRDIAKMVATVDRNGDGKLGYQEFVRLMKQPTSPTTITTR